MARDTKDLIGFISIQVFHMSGNSIDEDQRLTRDLEKLTADLSGLLTGMVKPSVDILWYVRYVGLISNICFMVLGLNYHNAKKKQIEGSPGG